MSRNECNLAQVTRFENSRSSNEGASCTIYLIEQLANETSDLASDMENFSRSTPLVYTLWLLDEGVHPASCRGRNTLPYRPSRFTDVTLILAEALDCG